MTVAAIPIDYESLIAGLGQILGIDGLAWDDAGMCTFEVDDGRWQVFLQARKSIGEILLFAPVGQVSAHELDKAGRRLAEFNLFQIQTEGGALGLLSSDQTIFLSKGMPVSGMDGDALSLVLGNFIENAGQWRSRFADPAWPQQEPDSLPGDGFIKA